MCIDVGLHRQLRRLRVQVCCSMLMSLTRRHFIPLNVGDDRTLFVLELIMLRLEILNVEFFNKHEITEFINYVCSFNFFLNLCACICF